MRIELAQGDITALAADAIVNAANEELVLGSGVAGAIRRKGGPAVQAECDRLAPIGTGQAVATTAGALPQRYVIHAVAPRISMPDWEALLGQAVTSVIRCAEELGLRSVGVPALGTGAFGLPLERAAQIMIAAARAAAPGCRSLERLIFCLYDAPAHAAFGRALAGA